MNFNERDLYSGLAAQHYAIAAATSTHSDKDFFRRVVLEGRGRALELGCGTGRLLLAYVQEGLVVDGVDISADMLSICRETAAASGLQPKLYEQCMQNLNLPDKYATIYIACGGFGAVMSRHEALDTLRRCFAHLQTGGRLVFNTPLPPKDVLGLINCEPLPSPWQLRDARLLPNSRRLIVHQRLTGVDQVEQISTLERRYRLYAGVKLLHQEVHCGQERWYRRNELLWMLELAGFDDVVVTGDYTDEAFSIKHEQTMVFMTTKRGAA